MAAWLTRGGAGVTHGSRWETCLPSPGQCGERLSLKLPVDMSLLECTPGASQFPSPFLFILLECSCYTVLCWLLPHDGVNQIHVYIHALPLNRPATSLGRPSADLSFPCLQRLPLAVCVTRGRVFMSVLFFLFVSPSPSLPCLRVHFMSASLFLP